MTELEEILFRLKRLEDHLLPSCYECGVCGAINLRDTNCPCGHTRGSELAPPLPLSPDECCGKCAEYTPLVGAHGDCPVEGTTGWGDRCPLWKAKP